MLTKKKRSSKLPKTPQADNFAKCDYCGETFNWRYEGLATAAKREYCSHACHSKSLENAARLVGAIDFDDL